MRSLLSLHCLLFFFFFGHVTLAQSFVKYISLFFTNIVVIEGHFNDFVAILVSFLVFVDFQVVDHVLGTFMVCRVDIFVGIEVGCIEVPVLVQDLSLDVGFIGLDE